MNFVELLLSRRGRRLLARLFKSERVRRFVYARLYRRLKLRLTGRR